MNRPPVNQTLLAKQPTAPLIERFRGNVQHVDVVSREITVLRNNVAIVFDVGPNCQIVLRGERVKLRMIQPRDEVRISFVRRGPLWVAHRVEVQPGA